MDFFIVFNETILESHLISNIQLKSNCFLHEAGHDIAVNVRKSKFVAILKLQLILTSRFCQLREIVISLPLFLRERRVVKFKATALH